MSALVLPADSILNPPDTVGFPSVQGLRAFMLEMKAGVDASDVVRQEMDRATTLHSMCFLYEEMLM